MAMLLVVATTEATDPTRVSVSFRTTANVSESSSVRFRGEARGVAEEVRVGEIVNCVSPNMDPPKTNGTYRVVSPEKEVMHDG